MRPIESKVVLLAMLLLGWFSTAGAQSPTAAKVVANLKARFNETGVFSAHFEQTIDDSFDSSGEKSVLTGTIIAGHDGYRIEMPHQTVVTDDTTTWVYLKSDQQVIINNYVQDETSFSPNQFIGDQAQEFSSKFGDSSDPTQYVIRLQPESPDSYIDTATLWVRKKDYVVTRIDVVDVNGASMRFKMSNIDFHPKVSADTFRFAIPDGVEVIDLRS